LKTIIIKKKSCKFGSKIDRNGDNPYQFKKGEVKKMNKMKITLSAHEYIEITVNGGFATIENVHATSGRHSVTVPTLVIREIANHVEKLSEPVVIH
jgi:hypothetical protein